MGERGLRLEKREETSLRRQLLFGGIGLIAALGASCVLIASAGANVIEAVSYILLGSFGGWGAVSETLVQATPLIFTGLAAVIAFRGGIWNIGAEGQFYAGAMVAFWVGMRLEGVPQPFCVAIIAIFALTAGAVWGFIPGLLKARFNANEIIVTVMMNYIILYVFSYLLINFWRDPTGSGLLQTPFLITNAHFPALVGRGRLHVGFLFSLLAAVLISLILWKTPFGYEIRALGDNPSASRYKGININRTVIMVMIVSGAIAGLAGGSEFAGTLHRARLDMSTGYGYTGIIIALLAKLNPLGVILAAVFFGGLINGSTLMQVFTKVPVALVYCVQGIVLISVLSAEVLAKYRIRRIY